MTFNNEGKKIDRLRLEGLELKSDELINIELTKPFHLVANVLEMAYEKPMEDEGLWNNKVVSRTPIASYHISINEFGKISKTRVAA